ncbi:MAG: multidrug DMT transporter permease [Acidobacteria bacterium]|nr:MAG: multidrug DMT transporter permease [Acidobacteriota bacterium]
MNQREKVLAYAAWIAVCLIWGTTYLAIRVAVKALPDALLSGVRFTIAGGLMMGFFWLRGEKFPPFHQWIHLAVVGLSLIGIGNWLVVWAEKEVPSGPTALLVATTPFWMAAIESLLSRGEAWTSGKVFGLMLGFAGVALLVWPELKGNWNAGYWSGILVLQIASAAWACGSLYSKYKHVDSKPLINASLQMFLGGLFLILIALFRGEFRMIQWQRDSIVAFIYLVTVGAMIGYVCYIYALAKLPSSTVFLYAYINPVIAVWLGWMILNEKVTVYTFLATAVILAGIWVIRRQPVRELKQVTPG